MSACEGVSKCSYVSCTKNGKCIYQKRVRKKYSTNKNIVNYNLPKNKPTMSKAARRLVKKGHKPECLCCKGTKELTFDHIKSLVSGGANNDGNGQILCFTCNGYKAGDDITIEELRIRRKEMIRRNNNTVADLRNL